MRGFGKKKTGTDNAPVERQAPQRRSSVRQEQNTVVQATTERSRATRKLTGKQQRMQRKASKLNAADKKRILENKDRYLAGKKQKEASTYKPSIWERMIEKDVADMFRLMGEKPLLVRRFQRKRVIMSLLLCVVGLLAGAFVHKWLYMAGPVVGFAFYKMRAKAVTTYFRAWKFERQLNFSKFTRLVIPYLKAGAGKTPLYAIFTKILRRTEKPADKRSLSKLMADMAARPQDIVPFQEFAERSSGTDMSYLFMSTIYDFQQSTFDTTVIDELGKMAADDMMNAIDEIIEMKLRRFVMFPTKVVLSSFILVAGLGAGLIVYNFKDLDFSGASINPEADAKKAEDSAGDAKDAASDDKKATPEEQMQAKDDAKAKAVADQTAKAKAPALSSDSAKKKAEPAKPKEPKEPKWRTDIVKIADASGTKRDKFYESSAYASNFKPTKDELSAFEGNMRETFADGSYLRKQGDAATLVNIFQAEVLWTTMDATGKEKLPLRQAAFDYWANTKFVFMGDKQPEDTLIQKNAKAIEKNLAPR